METDELCRTCLDSENVMVPLFEDGEPCLLPLGNVLLVDLLRSFGEVEILYNDGLPLQICTPCIKELQQAHTFKLKCKKSENTLMKLKEAKLLNAGITEGKQNAGKTSNTDLSTSNKKGSFLEGEIIDIDDDDEDEEQFKTDAEDDLSLAESYEQGLDMDEEMIAKLSIVLDDHKVTEIRSFDIRKNTAETKRINANHRKSSKIKAEIYDINTLKGYKMNEIDIECPACSKTIENLDSLRKHIIENHTKGEACFVCDAVSGVQTTDIWKHCINHLPRKHACPVCGKTFIKRTYLRAHFKLTHSGPRREVFHCKLCSKSFKTRSGISYHRQVAHAAEKPYSCEICDARFAHIKLLRLHMLSFHTDGPPKCRFCGQVFNAYSTMLKHVRRYHKGLNKMKVTGAHQNNFKCAICSKTFAEKQLLEAHIIGSHTNFRQFKCTHCPFTFKYKTVMAMHVNSQHPNAAVEEKIEKCEICFKSVPSLQNLSSHMERVHTNIRPYLCIFCSYSFKIESNLENHMSTIHTNRAAEIEYKCDECDNVFKNRDHLIEHKTIEHNFIGPPPVNSAGSYDATDFIFRTMFQ